MNNEYFWWDLDETLFKGLLYDSIGLYFVEENTYKSWEELLENDPHMAYAYLVNTRFDMLEQQFIDLRVIPQMLGVEDIPLKSSVENINRYDWLKSIVDLALFRFSSIRDILFHFVNEILELKIEDYNLNIKSFKKLLNETYPNILDGLKKIDSAGFLLRNERNERAHKGFYNLFTDDDQLFKHMSSFESYCKIDNYDLIKTYQDSKEKIYDNVISEIKAVLLISITIVDELYIPYRDNFEKKSLISIHGMKWSQHFQLHQKKQANKNVE